MIEDFENEQETQSKLFLKSEFIDDVVKNVSKLNTVKSKNNICTLLEVALAELSGDNRTDSDDDENEDNLNIKDLDENQVWALIENYSKNYLNELKSFNVKKCGIILDELKNFNEKDKMLNNKRERDDIEEEEDEEDDDEYEDNPLDQNDLNIDDEEDDELPHEEPENKNLGKDKKEKKSNKKEKDNFFSFEEMNKFADEGEVKMNYNMDESEQKIKKNEGESDEDIEDDEIPNEDLENKEFKYEDFFDSTDQKKSKKAGAIEDQELEYDDEEIENNIFDIENKLMKNNKDEIKQEYQIMNKDLKTHIEEIESKMMSKKDWNMKGEATGRERPKGSLLENFLDFEVSVKPPPIPTPEYADTIESLIKLRIKEDLFDDPVRKPQIEMNKKNSNFELNFEKNKKGLANIYEEDYAKDVLKITSESEGQAVKNEIEEMCGKLYSIFDKLTNNNFVSGNRNTEMKIITNVPAVQLEEISNYVTDNKTNTKSAHELFSNKDAEIKTRDEFTREERKTSHKNWKRNVRNKLREKVRNQKLNAMSKIADSKFEAKLMMKRDNDKNAKKNVKNSELKSSKFFSNLQTIASDDVEKKKMKGDKRNRVENENEFGNKKAKTYKI
jgi:U3 small nucleolar RNA-associated protein MPP10